MKCSKNLKRGAFKTDTSKRDSSMLLETESPVFKILRDCQKKTYNTEKLNRVGLHDPVEILKDAGRIARKQILPSTVVCSS